VTAAGTHADATSDGLGEVTVVGGEGERGGQRTRAVVRAQPQVVDGRRRIDDLAGVHLGFRIPQCLELPERVDQFGAVHLGQERRARLAVAVFTGEGAAIPDADVGGVIQERAEGGDAVGAGQVEVDAGVDTALPVVAV